MGENRVFSTNGVGITGYSYSKEGNWTRSLYYTEKLTQSGL